MIEITMRTRVFKMYIFILCCILLFSCNMPTIQTDAGQSGESVPTIEEISELFEKDEVSGTYTFFTNDTTYIKPNGYTLWHRVEQEVSFSPFTTEISKISGNYEAGYGVIFCEGFDLNGDISLLFVFIRTDGKYTIGKIEKGRYENIVWWTDAYEHETLNNVLDFGYSTKNSISINYDSGKNEYLLSINEKYIQSFEDTREEKIVNGNTGYAVVLSANESFPFSGVEVTFKNIEE